MKFLKKPVLHNFLSIKTKSYIAVKLEITLEKNTHVQSDSGDELVKPSTPWQSLNLFSQRNFEIKILAFGDNHELVYEKNIRTDQYAQVRLNIPTQNLKNEIKNIEVYETSYHPGIDVLLGHFIPTKLDKKFNLIISDFDKTLVQTSYSTFKEVYNSLNSPLNEFPKIKDSIDILKDYIDKGYTPFILSASPHFYEKPFRDWLYFQGIFTNNIFLKNYNKLFSPFDNDLSSKDLTNQGYYKLNQLIDILLMTDLPEHLVLIGDAFESDPLVYLLLRSLLLKVIEPDTLFNLVKDLPSFQIKRQQSGKFLVKLNQISNLSIDRSSKVSIYIRCLVDEDVQRVKIPTELNFLENQKKFINFYTCDSTT